MLFANNKIYKTKLISAEEIWEECICDSLGEMNIFVSDEMAGELFDKILPEIKKAAKTTKLPTQTRGSPDGKASRETNRSNKLKGSRYLTYNFSGVVNVNYANVYVPDEEIEIIRSSVKTGWGRLNSERTVGGVFTANEYYVFTYNADNSITIVNSFDLATQNQTVDIIKEAINDAKFGKDKLEAVSRWIDSIRNGRGGRFTDYTNDAWKEGKSGKTYVLDDGTSESNTEGNHESGSKNSKGKASRALDSKYYSPEEAKDSGKVSDAKFSIEFAEDIANKQRQFANERLSRKITFHTWRKKMNIWDTLYERALEVQNGRVISPFVDAGGVAAAILTKEGNIYVGVCIDTCSSLGMCAERNAIANMITNGESEIDKVVAVMTDGRVGSPCGACRELMMQLSERSFEIEILTDKDRHSFVTLGELMPDWWGKERFERG